MEFKDRQGNHLNRKKLKIISQSPTEMIVDMERYDNATEEGTQINAQVFNNFQSEINSSNAKADSAVSTATTSNTTANTANQKSDLAVTKADKAVADSAQAVITSNSANTTSNQALTTAQSALTKSESAVSSAATAVNTANTANSTANTANSNSQSAVTIATTAKQNSETAVATANRANSNASTALANSEKAIEDSTFAKEKSIAVEKALADRGATVLFGQDPQSTVTFDSNPQTQINSKLSKSFANYPVKTTLANNDTFIIQDAQTTENKNVSMAAIASSVMNATYPIGAIYLSVNSTNPGEIFGGTWERIMGKFLLGADDNSYLPGTTGGEAVHTLTEAEMPTHKHNNTISVSAYQNSHSHGLQSSDNYSTNCNGLARSGSATSGGMHQVGGVANNNGGTYYCYTAGNGNSYVEYTAPQITVDSGITNVDAGSGQSHNNMPPYLAVYMWKRIG